MRTNFEFRPTLVIGLGGTGHGVLLQLKKRLMEKFGTVPPVIRFLAIDTTQEAERTEYTSDQTLVELDSDDEQCIVRVEDPSSLLGTRNRHIEEWWSTGTPVSAIVSGAQQIRALGRLALFANYDDIKSRITQKMDEVRHVDNQNVMEDDGLSVSGNTGVEVFIVTSLAGGTGSGMFLDIAFLARNIVPSSSVTGLFVLPRVFAKLPGTELIKTNTYAALKEIEYFSKLKDTDRLSINFGINVVPIKRPPFDLTYLVDSINESEKVIDSYKLLHSQIAEGLYLLIGSEIGTGSSNAMDNIKSHLASAGLVENRTTNYCSFGVSSCTWNSEDYQEEFESLRSLSAHALVEEIVNATANAEDLRADVYKFTQTYNLNKERVATFLQALDKQGRGNKSSTFGNEIISGMRFSKDSTEEIRKRHGIYIANAETHGREELEDAYKQLKNLFHEEILDWKKQTMSRPDFLSYITHFSEALLTEMSAIQDAITGQLNKARNTKDSIKFQEKEALISKRTRSFFARAKRIRDACINYAGEVDRYRQLAFKEMQCEKALDLLGEFKIEIESMLQENRQFRKALNTVLNSLRTPDTKSSSSSKKERNPFVRVFPLQYRAPVRRELTSAEFAEWYQSQGSLDSLLRKPSDEIKRDINSFVFSRYGTSGEMTMDEVIRTHMKENEAEEKLTHLSHLAAPLWRYNKDLIPVTLRNINKISYCGVSNSKNPPTNNLKGGWLRGMEPRYINIIDPDRITFFNISFGVPLFALNGIREMEEEYNARRKAGTAYLHLHRDWQSFPDIIPKRLSKPLSCFAIAQAPGFSIVKRAESGMYSVCMGQSDGTLREVTLDLNPEDAFSKFEKNSDIVDTVRQAVHDIINNQDQNLIKSYLTSQQDKLLNLIQNNGLNTASKEFVQREISAIQDYLDGIYV